MFSLCSRVIHLNYMSSQPVIYRVFFRNHYINIISFLYNYPLLTKLSLGQLWYTNNNSISYMNYTQVSLDMSKNWFKKMKRYVYSPPCLAMLTKFIESSYNND